MTAPLVTWHDLAVGLPEVVMCFWIGLYPPPFLNTMKASVENVLVQMDAKKKARVAAAPAPAGESAASGAQAVALPAPAPGTKR